MEKKIHPYTFVGMNIASTTNRKKIIENIFNTLENISGRTESEIKSKNRSRDLVDYRRIAMHYCINELHMSLTETGKIFNRDHSTVIYNNSYVNENMKYDALLKKRFDRFMSLSEQITLLNGGGYTISDVTNA